MPDIQVNDQGSIVILTPLTEAAVLWFANNVQEPPPYMRLGAGYACDHRMAQPIIDGAEEEGLTCG